jgi:hypothetical protein
MPEVHVQHGAVETFPIYQGEGLLDRKRRPHHVVTEILGHLLDQHGDQHLVFHDKNSAAGRLRHAMTSMMLSNSGCRYGRPRRAAQSRDMAPP